MIDLNETIGKLWDKVTTWFEHFVLILPNLAVAAVLMVLIWLVARQVKRISQNLFRRIVRSDEVAWLISIAIYLTILGTGLVVALGIVGLDKTVTSLLAGAGIAGLAIALAFQDLGQNILAGIYISLRRTIKVGDLIETNGLFGSIKEINLRSLHLNMPDGQIVSIPNREVFQNPVRQFSTGRRRVELEVGVSYGDDLERVKKITIAAVEPIEGRVKDRSVELFFEGFGDSSINLVVRFWIHFKEQGEFMQARSEAVMRIHQAYHAHDITIPFPIRTLDFGIKGGEKLSTTLQGSQIRTLVQREDAD